MLMVMVVMMMTTESSGPSWNLQQRAAISLLAVKAPSRALLSWKSVRCHPKPDFSHTFFPPVFNHMFFLFFFAGFLCEPQTTCFFFYSFETPPPKTTPNSTVDPAVESFFWLRDLQRRPLWSLRTKNWSKGATCVVAFVGLEDLVEHLELLATRNSGEVSMVIKPL